MNTITKEQKINYLKDDIATMCSIGYQSDDELDALYNDMTKDYLHARAILLDYAPELEAKYPDNFSTAILFWIAENNG
jgi:hypothetical protein